MKTSVIDYRQGDPPDDTPLFNRDFVLVTLTSFIFFFTYHSFILLPLRIEELGGSESVIGFIMGSASAATILTTPSVGILIDKWGKKWFLLAGGLLMSVTSLPFAFLDSLGPAFPALRILHGAALSLCFVSAGTLIADVSSPARRSQAIGIFGLFSVINFALAPFVGKKIVEAYGFGDLFIFDFFFGSSAFVAALFIREPAAFSPDGVKGSGFREALFRSGVFPAAFALLVAGTGFVSAITFVPVFAKRIGVHSFELFFITYTVAIIAVRLIGGWIPDKFGKKRASIPAFFMFAAGIVAIGLASGPMGLVLAGVFFGLGHGLFYPAIYALVIDLSPEADRGKAVSICSVAFTLGGMLGVFIYGVVAEHWGFRLMFDVSGAVCAIGFILFAFKGKEAESGFSRLSER
ncbi:MAG TPA: MFS transporter [Thermodesulfobacteriota bacterium]|jgi:MFS family permease|nr:MFS transporter [Thermodesulfobacteriota bacterium]